MSIVLTFCLIGPDTEDTEWLERRYERTLICLSSSITTFKTPPLQQYPLLHDFGAFIEWSSSTVSDVLNVHGSINMTETSEQLFYVLDQQATRAKGHGPVLYFSFSRHDTTRNTLKNMLATFLCQMICHNANNIKCIGQLVFVQSSEEHGWTERDLLQWFSHCSSDLFTESAYLVIDGFDECPESGRDCFLEWLSGRMASGETLWKLAFTSRKPLSLPRGQQGWRQIDQALAMASDKRPGTNMQTVEATELKGLLARYRPDLSNDNAWIQSINQVVSSNTLVQQIMLEYSMSIPEWPRKLSVNEIFDLVDTEDHGDELLLRVLDIVFRKLPEQFQLTKMLNWLLYSARPLSIWEFTSVMYPQCLDSLHASPGPDNVREFVQICETHFRGVIEIRDTMVRIRDSKLRELLTMPPRGVSPAYPWDDVDADQAAYHITETCLRFLGNCSVQQELGVIVEQVSLGEHTYGPVLGYPNFCSYAAYYWPQHAALIPKTMGLSFLLEEHKHVALNVTWMKAYWCLSNPVTRSRQPSESVDALLASLGLPHSPTSTWDQSSVDFAIQSAAAQGDYEMLRNLLLQCEQAHSTLMDTLIAAVSSGQEELVLHVLSQIKNDENGGSGASNWPPCLLYRAAWLGMDKFARALLEAGCSSEPGGPMALKPLLSPLHQATRNGHIATMEALLSYGADTNFKTIYDRGMLFAAIDSRRSRVLKALFEKGKVNLMDRDEFKNTPLGYASACGQPAAIKSLLDIGADPHDDMDFASSNIGWLPLVKGAREGRAESVRVLLDSDADPNQPGPDGVNTALWYAAGKCSLRTMRALLEGGADPDHPLLQQPILVTLVSTTRIETPVKLEMIKLMAEFGAKIDAADEDGRTSLMWATHDENEDLVECLLELGASVNTETRYKVRPLHLASMRGSEAIVNLLLAKNPRLDCLDDSGCTALYRSAQRGFSDVTRILLEKGANPDLTENLGLTPLYISALEGFSNTVKVLLDHGAQVNLQTEGKVDDNPGGWTAVSAAANSDAPEIVKLLIDAGASLSLKSNTGAIPLHVAILSTARVLLQHRKRFNLDELDNDKDTPLHCAIRTAESAELTKLMIESGANLNLQNNDGDTAICVAANLDNHEAVRLLLREEDCDPNLTSNYGKGPLHYSLERSESLETVKLLVESGADINRVARSDVGSPIQTACRNAKAGKEMVEYLLERGADLHAQAGTSGFAISSAASHGTPEIISLLLQKGATANVIDAMGRAPIHISCVGGALNFQEIYKAGGNQNLRDRDKLKRSVFHWAAQHGLPEVLEILIAELGTELIDAPDVDDWTPLLWACRPGMVSGANSEPTKDDDQLEQRQGRVFRILLGNGARPDVSGKIGDTVWSLRHVALFNKIPKSCLQQVEEPLVSITGQPSVPSGIMDSTKERIGAFMNRYCDSCYYVRNSSFNSLIMFGLSSSVSLSHHKD